MIHELYGLNDNIRDICHRFAEQGYAALGVDLFAGRNKAVCMTRILVDWLAGRLDDFAVADLKAALAQLVERPEVDDRRVGAVGFGLGGTLAPTWACTDRRLKAIGPYYGSAPRRREALRRLCPVVGSWPEKDFTSSATGTLETELTSAGVAHDLKLYPDAKHSFFNDRESNYDAAAAADSVATRVVLLRRAHQSWTKRSVTAEPPRGARLPPRWFIRAFWLVHRGIYSVTGGLFGLRSATGDRWGMLRLRTVGRRTGEQRSVILGYFEDGPNLVTMAMNGWAKPEPAWWLNLKAQPDTTVDLADGSRPVHARAADKDEQPRLWARWADYNANLEAYAALRARATEVVILEPRP